MRRLAFCSISVSSILVLTFFSLRYYGLFGYLDLYNSVVTTYDINESKDAPIKDSFVFDYGTVIAKPGGHLSHRFSFVNSMSHAIRILDLVNAKPCCGSISPVASQLIGPGESIDFEVSISIATSGPLFHKASLLTDDTKNPKFDYYSKCNVLAPLMLIPLNATAPTPMVVGLETSWFRYKLISSATNLDELEDLDGYVASSMDLEPVWEGKSQTVRTGDNSFEQTRILSIKITGTENPGASKSSLILKKDGNQQLLFDIFWNTESAIKSTPAALIVSNRGTEITKEIKLHSSTPEKFYVIKADIDGTSVLRTKQTESEDLVQTINIVLNQSQIEQLHGTTSKQSIIRITTNHPRCRTVTVPVFLVGTK